MKQTLFSGGHDGTTVKGKLSRRFLSGGNLKMCRQRVFRSQGVKGCKTVFMSQIYILASQENW